MRLSPAPMRSRTRGARTATGPRPVMIARSGRWPWRTSRWRPSSVCLSAWRLRKAATSASTACASRARAPSRRTSVSGSENSAGWISLTTLSWIMACHSFGGEVEARTPPRYAASTPHAVTNFRAYLTVAATPALRALVKTPRSRDSENTIGHKDLGGGSLDFVGSNSPTDLASRPKRIILADEIDKYPVSAGSEGDPLKLGEERASTYKDVGRAKFVRTCSPTVKGECRITREYEVSDQRKCFVACPRCGHEQVLTWGHVRWDKGPNGEHLPATAGITCEDCGAVWTEPER